MLYLQVRAQSVEDEPHLVRRQSTRSVLVLLDTARWLALRQALQLVPGKTALALLQPALQPGPGGTVCPEAGTLCLVLARNVHPEPGETLSMLCQPVSPPGVCLATVARTDCPEWSLTMAGKPATF